MTTASINTRPAARDFSPAIGVSTAAFYPTHATEDALILAGELGFPVVEVFLQALEEYSPAFGRELDRRRRDAGVRVHSLHLHVHYCALWSPYARARRETRDRFAQVVETAARLEARAITWHGIRYGFGNPALMQDFFESALWAAEQAHAAGVTLCVENVSWCYLRAPKHVVTLRELGAPLGFVFDSFQAAEAGVSAAEMIRAMDGGLKTVHLSDYAPGGPRHLPLGEGIIDWAEVFAALRAINYSGPLLIELAHVTEMETLRASREFLQRKLWLS